MSTHSEPENGGWTPIEEWRPVHGVPVLAVVLFNHWRKYPIGDGQYRQEDNWLPIVLRIVWQDSCADWEDIDEDANEDFEPAWFEDCYCGETYMSLNGGKVTHIMRLPAPPIERRGKA